MKLAGQLIIYSVVAFGIVALIPTGLKPTTKIALALITAALCGVQVFGAKRSLVADSLISLLAVLLSGNFALFLFDLSITPVAVAQDCEGHEPSRMHYLDVTVLGAVFVGIAGFLFIKTHKQKDVVDRACVIVILTLIACCWNSSLFSQISREISSVSRPKLVFPEGCE